MESEQVKACNEHAPKTATINETSFTAEKTREASSAPPPLEVHNGENESISLPPEPTEMKSPPIQTMEQPPGYDPNRIPSSIFSSKIGNPTDWSSTSNESLFSIHMGNNSFSNDYTILFGKSGELPKLEDWNGTQSNPFMMPGELPRLEEWNNSPYRHVSVPKSIEFGSLPPVIEENGVLSSMEFFKKDDQDISPKFVSGQTIESDGKEKCAPATKKPPLPETYNSSLSTPMASPSPSSLSDASGQSSRSFAFPVLGSHDSGKNASIKVVTEMLEKPEKGEQQEAQAQMHVLQETPANISGTRCFSCSSCWPRLC